MDVGISNYYVRVLGSNSYRRSTGHQCNRREHLYESHHSHSLSFNLNARPSGHLDLVNRRLDAV